MTVVGAVMITLAGIGLVWLVWNEDGLDAAAFWCVAIVLFTLYGVGMGLV